MQPIFAICQEEAIVASAEQSVNRSVPGFYTGESHHLQKSEWFFSLCEQSQDLEIPEQFKTTKSVERLVLQRMWQRANDFELVYGGVVCSRGFIGCAGYHEVFDIEQGGSLMDNEPRGYMESLCEKSPLNPSNT
ncbi:hypothetical protein T4D_13404 [Trichinella pseudospiralis]|uniref:Uncharacterized protein n=1 Tax=Trichinella pseudospiralis TaxID=6337 RepID=A0A0V1G396_TRIPS|nr:hypothetical protein T4D_13404 [Trichinella pseudospiralis]